MDVTMDESKVAGSVGPAKLTEQMRQDASAKLGTELSVLERLVLLSFLPKEGDFTTIKLLRKLRENLSFDEEEHKKLSFIQEGDQVRWNEDVSKDMTRHIAIGEKQSDIIQDALKKLNEEKKLTNDHFSLYEKFVENRED